MKKLNFYSGPAILPQTVMQQAAEAIGNFAGTGLSILEVSHRSKEFVAVMEEARALVKEIMQLDSRYEVLFLHGGALSQFHMVPMNLLNENETANYFDTGTWAHGATEEAKLFGNVHVACSSADKNYTYIPKQYSIAPNSKYLHVTSNNTIYGTQLRKPFMAELKGKAPILVCDMSSDIFSQQVNYNQFDLIYAGAQKNTGAAGVTLVVINKEILGTVSRAIPKMLDYSLHIKKDSMLNTPSVFAVYVAYCTLQWIKEQGIAKLEEQNIKKAELLYGAIDDSAVFEGTVAKDDRSLMNVCFRLKEKQFEDQSLLEKRFVTYCDERDIVGIKGHRSVGGFRASIYNAMDLAGVQTLADAIKDFEQTL